MSDIEKYLPQCLNCGYPLEENYSYCPNCSQRTRGSKIPVGDLISDFIQDYFTVDKRFFKSVYWLLLRPGRLTRAFVEGKRKSQIAPFRIYLFSSFIYFFLLALVMKDSDSFEVASGSEIDRQKMALLDSLKNTSGVDTARLRETLDSLDRVREETAIVFNTDTTGNGEGFWEDFEAYVEEKGKKINDDPREFQRSLFKSISISLFFLVPVFGLLLWALNYRRSRYFVENLVHSVHVHAFLFTILTIHILLSFADVHILGWILLISYVYLILSLRVVYQQGYFKSILKSVLLVLAYAVVILIALIPALIGALVMV
jgi:hypothetical protein